MILNSKWIHEHEDWPEFAWDGNALQHVTDELSYSMLIWESLKTTPELQNNAEIEFLTETVVKSSNIEGVYPDQDTVRKFIKARMENGNSDLYSTSCDGMIDMIMDAYYCHEWPLTRSRILHWHQIMFPAGRSDEGHSITSGNYRNDQVVIGSKNPDSSIREVFYKAPDYLQVPAMMDEFIEWFEYEPDINPYVKVGIAHIRFEQIHPFDDGNGRIGRALCDLLLARIGNRDNNAQPFHCLSSQIEKETSDYYRLLSKFAKGNSLDITEYLVWFLSCLNRSMESARKNFELLQMDKISE